MAASVELGRASRTPHCPRVRPPAMPAHTRSRALLGLLAAGILLTMAFARAHPFVEMTNDRQGQPLFGAGALRGGEPASAPITLGNDGVLPYTYAVRTRGALPAGSRITIADARTGTRLYSGPPPANEVVLGRLDPGQNLRLRVELNIPAASRLDGAAPTFIWSATATGWSGWEIGPLALIDALGLALLARGLRRSQPDPFVKGSGFVPAKRARYTLPPG